MMGPLPAWPNTKALLTTYYSLLTSCHRLLNRDRATDAVFFGSNGDDAVYQYSVATQVSGVSAVVSNVLPV